jgi:hypothetical protein
MTFVVASTENESSDSGDEGGGTEEGSNDESEPETEPETEPEPEPEPETVPEDTTEPPTETVIPVVPGEPEPKLFQCADNTLVESEDQCPQPEPTPALPICDGSAQRCITGEGIVCEIGDGSHACECAEDMSNCPNHPSLLEPPVEEPTCPPGQFPVTPGDPSTCVDCEGPCPEPPPAEGPDEDCLFNPSLPKCASDNGICPEGFFQNEDGNCVPDHPNGCPEGFHSHEDDETGQCIPNDVPCEPGYIINPSFPTCEKKESVCAEFPEAEGCTEEPEPCPPGFDLKNDVCHKEITIIINKIIKETNSGKHHDGFPDVDIIGLSVKDNGDAMICAFDIDSDNIQCQDFQMESDKVNQDFWRVIETDHNKDYDNGNTGSDDIDDAIEDIKSQDFSELKDADNHDFGIDLAFVAINPQGDGVTCLNTDQSGKGKSLCEPFKVSSEDVSGQITEGVEFG